MNDNLSLNPQPQPKLATSDHRPTIISYRSPSDSSSKFINISKLKESNNINEIKDIYKNIFNSITAYDAKYAEKLNDVEHQLYTRIAALHQERKENINIATKGLTGILMTICTLGINQLVGSHMKKKLENEIREIELNRTAFLKAHTQMIARAEPKQVYLKPNEIMEIEQKRLSKPDEELKRLMENERIQKSLNSLDNCEEMEFTNAEKIALGHSLELQEALKETHYVFNHGQNIELMVVNMLVKHLSKEFKRDIYNSYEPLRDEIAFQDIKEDTHTVDWYKTQIGTVGQIRPEGEKRFKRDNDFRKELICADCILESTLRQESALHFLKNRSIAAAEISKNQFNQKLFNEIISEYITDKQVVDQLTQDLVKILDNCPKGGSLYSVCVPKTKFDESCYIAHDFGKFFDEKKHFPYKDHLEEMQSGDVKINYRGELAIENQALSDPEDSEDEMILFAPQIRILAQKINPVEGFHVVRNSTITDNEIQKIEDAVLLSLQAALTGNRVSFDPQKYFKDSTYEKQVVGRKSGGSLPSDKIDIQF